MGLETREAGTYITILGGKFCQRVKEGSEGAVERINKMNVKVYERFYDSFTGTLVNIKVKEGGEYGDQWVLTMKDKDDMYFIQLPYSNSYAKALLKMLPNIDLSKPFKMSPSLKEVDGKNQSSLFVNQDGVAIKHAYTKDMPNGLPQMVQKKVSGKLVWDDTDVLDFLKNMVETKIVPKLAGASLDEMLPEEPKTAQQLLDEEPF